MNGVDLRKPVKGDESPEDELMDDDDLRDAADDFEDALIAEMTRTGAIEIW